MAFYRGGRGRGRFGNDRVDRFAKQEPFLLYPEINLPSPPKISDELVIWMKWERRFDRFSRSSPYYLGDGTGTSDPLENLDPDGYPDKEKPKNKISLMDFLQPTAAHFPRELVEGLKLDSRKKRKKLNWDTQTDLEKFDFFAKLEQQHEAQKEKGEEKEDAEDDEGDAEDEEEFSDNGDYDQNIDFDDDEDDYNMEDNNDEGEY